MNKKGQAAFETSRWMMKNFAYIFIFVIVAGFIYAIVTSFMNVNIEAEDATTYSIASALAECMKTNNVFSLDKSNTCTKFNEYFSALYTLNGKDQAEANSYYSTKTYCVYKEYTCGKDTFVDRQGNVLGIEWVMRR